jgi:hypothetical protein
VGDPVYGDGKKTGITDYDFWKAFRGRVAFIGGSNVFDQLVFNFRQGLNKYPAFFKGHLPENTIRLVGGLTSRGQDQKDLFIESTIEILKIHFKLFLLMVRRGFPLRQGAGKEDFPGGVYQKNDGLGGRGGAGKVFTGRAAGI